MKRTILALALTLLLSSTTLAGSTDITLARGSTEDAALQAPSPVRSFSATPNIQPYVEDVTNTNLYMVVLGLLNFGF